MRGLYYTRCSSSPKETGGEAVLVRHGQTKREVPQRRKNCWRWSVRKSEKDEEERRKQVMEEELVRKERRVGVRYGTVREDLPR